MPGKYLGRPTTSEEREEKNKLKNIVQQKFDFGTQTVCNSSKISLVNSLREKQCMHKWRGKCPWKTFFSTKTSQIHVHWILETDYNKNNMQTNLIRIK